MKRETKTTGLDRLPPHDQEAEQGALGCLLNNPSEAIPACQAAVPAGAEVFYDLRHQLIYSTLLELHNEGIGVDLITLQSRLKEQSLLEQVGGIAYLSTLPDATPSAANLPWYVETLQEKHIRRKILQVCTEQAANAFESSDGAETLLDETERAVMAIRQSKPKAGMGIKELVSESIQSIEATWTRKGAIEGIPTGLIDLDKRTGGLKAGEVTILAGFPGAGKTSLAMNIAEHAMIGAQKKVAVFSLEMSAVSLVTRFICSHAKVNLKNLNDGFLAEGDISKITGSAHAISTSKIWFEDDSDLSVYQLRAKARRLYQQHSIELVIIDYLQLLSASGGARKVESRQQEVADISRGIKALARELKIPVIALSQLNDDGKLRESRAIGQDADNVWVLKAKDGENEETDTAESLEVDLNIVKARNGPRGKVNLVFLQPYTRFESASRV